MRPASAWDLIRPTDFRAPSWSWPGLSSDARAHAGSHRDEGVASWPHRRLRLPSPRPAPQQLKRERKEAGDRRRETSVSQRRGRQTEGHTIQLDSTDGTADGWVACRGQMAYVAGPRPGRQGPEPFNWASRWPASFGRYPPFCGLGLGLARGLFLFVVSCASPTPCALPSVWLARQGGRGVNSMHEKGAAAPPPPLRRGRSGL